MHIKQFALLISLTILSGCATTVDHSSEKNFKSLVGEKILTKDAILCKNGPFSIEGSPEYNIEINWQKDLSECVHGEKLLDVQAGTKVSIRSVVEWRYFNLFTYQHWYLLGELRNESSHYQFYHFYGFSGAPQKPHWR